MICARTTPFSESSKWQGKTVGRRVEVVGERIESCNKEIFLGGRQWIKQRGCKGGSGVEVKGAAKICGKNKQVSGSLHIKYGGLLRMEWSSGERELRARGRDMSWVPCEPTGWLLVKDREGRVGGGTVLQLGGDEGWRFGRLRTRRRSCKGWPGRPQSVTWTSGGRSTRQP